MSGLRRRALFCHAVVAPVRSSFRHLWDRVPPAVCSDLLVLTVYPRSLCPLDCHSVVGYTSGILLEGGSQNVIVTRILRDKSFSLSLFTHVPTGVKGRGHGRRARCEMEEGGIRDEIGARVVFNYIRPVRFMEVLLLLLLLFRARVLARFRPGGCARPVIIFPVRPPHCTTMRAPDNAVRLPPSSALYCIAAVLVQSAFVYLSLLLSSSSSSYLLGTCIIPV